MDQQPYVICISGPTAAGKTQLAMDLYDQCNGALISVDSALIYRGMDIGTAKPNREELARYPHALVDILDPAQSYSAAEFRRDALDAIEHAVSAGKTPILVGGTMLYYRALLGGLANLPTADERVRARLQSIATDQGWSVLHDRLASLDPVAARRIHPNDPQRLIRALEVYELSGKTLTELTAQQQPGLTLPSYQFAVAPDDRKILHERIGQRFVAMLENGFIDEVEALRARGDLHLDLPSMRCVGYRQVWQHLDGEFNYPTLLEKGIAATRQLAKRQLTWLRSWPDLHWLDATKPNVAEAARRVLREQMPTKPQMWLKNA